MDIPLLGFLAILALASLPYTLVTWAIELWIVKVKSDFWDAYLVSFLSLIGSTVVGNLLMFLLVDHHWIVYSVLMFPIGVVVWFVPLRAIMKYDSSKCFKVALVMVVLSYIFFEALVLLGLEY